MFSKLITKLFKETTNVTDISPVTFNSSGTYDPRYGKQKIYVAGKASDGIYIAGNANYNYVAGYNYDNSYTYNQQATYDPTTVAAPGGEQYWTYNTVKVAYAVATAAGEGAPTSVYYVTTGSGGSAYPGAGNFGYAITYETAQYQYPSAVSFNSGSTTNSPTNYPPPVAGYNLWSGNILYDSAPQYAFNYVTGTGPTPSPYAFFDGYAYQEGSYQYDGAVAGTNYPSPVAGTTNPPNVYGAWDIITGTQYKYTRIWSPYNVPGNTYYYNVYVPGNSGYVPPAYPYANTNPAYITTGTSTNVLNVPIPGGYGAPATPVPATMVIQKPIYKVSQAVTIPTGGYVTITFSI